MTPLFVDSFAGQERVVDLAALHELLETRFEGANHFWLSGEERFPTLAVAVANEVASVHYFPEEGHPGFISLGDQTLTGDVVFLTGLPSETIEVGKRYTLSWELARRAVEEFSTHLELPRCLSWYEL